jgi:hypothetical protein
MCQEADSQPRLRVQVMDEVAMHDLADALMEAAPPAPGLVLLLHGGVGAGKSTLARAYIRAAAGDPGLPVPSPTFLLQQSYDVEVAAPVSAAPGADASSDACAAMPQPRRAVQCERDAGVERECKYEEVTIHHYDLYRLPGLGSGGGEVAGKQPMMWWGLPALAAAYGARCSSLPAPPRCLASGMPES